MPKRPNKRSSSKSAKRQPALKKKASFSTRRFTIYALVFALLAGVAVWKIFAAGGELQRIEAEQMVVPSGANLAGDPNASGALPNNLVKITGNGAQLGATVYTTSDISSFDVRAHTGSCAANEDQAGMTLVVDGKKIMDNITVSGSSWKTYSANDSLSGKTAHIIRLVFNRNPYACGSGNLLVDYISVNGPGTGEPSVRTGSNPITVASGNATTLQWGSTNTTGACSASGAWSGGQNQNGTWTTPALTGSNSGFGSYLYKLTCSGPHGTAFGASTVNVVPASAYSSLSGLPSATTLTIDPADAALSVNGKSVPNYTPTSITGTGATFWARINPNGSNTTYFFQYHKCKAALPPPTGGGSTNTGGCVLTDSTPWLQYPANPLPLGSGRIGVDVNTPYLTGLTPGTAYIYRVIAVNNVGATTDTGYVGPSQLTTAGTQSFYTAPR